MGIITLQPGSRVLIDTQFVATADELCCGVIVSNDHAWAGCTATRLVLLSDLLQEHPEFS